MTDAEREAWALFRYRLISPLLDPALTPPERQAYTTWLAAHPPTPPSGVPYLPAPRSLRRYAAAYRRGGFDALRPRRRADWGTRRTIPGPLWDQAALLKREVPERSAAQVCALLAAWAPTVGLDPAAVPRIRRATLYRQWRQAGLTRRALAVAAPKRYRRWEAPAPGALWQTDAMNGPWIPDPTPADPTRRRATYCVVLMDDYSRRVVAGQFAWAADAALLEDLLAAAVAQWGAPERVYCDNGKIYVSDRFATVLARLGTRLVHTPPYTPSGKGKQERFWGSLQASFLPELRVQPAASLGDLNRWFGAWLEEHYHRRTHSETGETPVARWGTGGIHRVVAAEPLRAAFRVVVERRVDKTGQVRWRGGRWLVPEGLLQTTVQLQYDPHQPDQVTVWQQDRCWGPAVRSDGDTPTTSPAAPPPATSGLSYLTLLAARQQARQPGVAYAGPPAEGPA